MLTAVVGLKLKTVDGFIDYFNTGCSGVNVVPMSFATFT